VLRFFEGAGEAEVVWPFTSKVWAALMVATIRIASRTDPLNADSIPPTSWLVNHGGDVRENTSPFVEAQMQETSDVVADFREPGQALSKHT
jgi:hypothetical protein